MRSDLDLALSLKDLDKPYHSLKCIIQDKNQMETKILIIDDSKEVRENAEELLKLSGYITYTAMNGKEGLELARSYQPDLIICDIMMPVLDGYGVLRALENIPEMTGVPFIFISAKAERSDFRKGMDLGADDYLTKPFNGDDLLSIVSTRLRKSRLLRKQLESTASDPIHPAAHLAIQESLDILSEHRTVKKLREKDMLYMEGDSPAFLYYILSGKLKLFKSNDNGKEYIVDILTEGEFLGYAALLEESKHKVCAMAIENSEVALIPGQDFFQLLYSNSEVVLKFAKLMSANYSVAEDKLINLAYDSARKRIAQALLFVAQKYKVDGSSSISFRLHRDNISALSGISPESVSRNLSEFKAEGLVETSNGNIKILNLAKLEAIKS